MLPCCVPNADPASRSSALAQRATPSGWPGSWLDKKRNTPVMLNPTRCQTGSYLSFVLWDRAIANRVVGKGRSCRAGHRRLRTHETPQHKTYKEEFNVPRAPKNHQQSRTTGTECWPRPCRGILFGMTVPESAKTTMLPKGNSFGRLCASRESNPDLNFGRVES